MRNKAAQAIAEESYIQDEYPMPWMKVCDELKKKSLLSDYFLRNAFSSDMSYKKNADELSKYAIAFEGLIEKISVSEIPKLDIQAVK